MTEQEIDRRLEEIVARANALRQQPHVVISDRVDRGIAWMKKEPGMYDLDACERMLTALSGCLDDAERDAALASQSERAVEQQERMKQERDRAVRNGIEARVVEHTAKRLGQLLAAPEVWAGSLDTAEVLMLELVEVWLVAMGGNEERAGRVTERWRAHLDEQTGNASSRSGASRTRWGRAGALASLMRGFVGKELTWPAVAVDMSKVGLDDGAYRFTKEGPWLLRG